MSSHNKQRSRVYYKIASSTIALSAAYLSATTVGLAQEATQDQPLILNPIIIDAKEDVLTGGVQVTEADLERIDAQDIRDVFRQEPGVTVGSPMTISQKIYVNGIEDSNLAVDVDGARQANKTYHHIGTTIVDPGILKAAKVESGVAPADAGPGALAGSISLETKEGRDFLDIDDTYGGFGKLAYNSNTKAFAKDLALAMRHDAVDILAYGTQYNGGETYEDGDGNKVAGGKPGNDNLLFKIGATNSDGYRIKFSANQFRDIGVRGARPNFSVTSLQFPQTVEYRRKNFTASFGDETPTDLWDPKLSLSYTKINLDIATPPAGGSTNLTADTTTINGKASNTFTIDLGKITSGVDFYIDEGEGGRDGASFTEEVSNYGAFTQVRLSPLEGLRTSFGGRIDHNRVDGNDGSSLDFTGLSGNANVEYDITSTVMTYAGLGTKFGSIPLNEVGIQTGFYDYNRLSPSRSRNYKTGLVYTDDTWRLEGQLFLTEIDDAPDPAATIRATYEDIESRGYTLSAKYTHDNGFIRGSYARSKVRVNSAPVASTAANYTGVSMGHTFGLEAVYDIPEIGLRLGSSNEAALKNREYPQPMKAYAVANLYAEWIPVDMDALTLRLDIKNLFDRTYADRANIGFDHTSTQITAFNEPGRTAIVSAKFDF